MIMHAGTNNLRDSTSREVAEKFIKAYRSIAEARGNHPVSRH